jgi:uncharacterized tellurite resistance protein B-like protein
MSRERRPKGLESLTRAERLQLIKFVSAAVWADLEVNPSEKTYLLDLALRMGLPGEDMSEWLEKPPPPEEVDPNRIPPEHRRIFLEAMEHAMRADRAIDSPELESLRLLRELLE